MNKLSLSEGGQPISLDDLEFLQSAIDQSLQFLTERLPNGIYFNIEEKSGEKEGDPRKLMWDDGVAIIGGKTAFSRKGGMQLRKASRIAQLMPPSYWRKPKSSLSIA